MLSAANRLRKRKDFDEVYGQGRGVSGPLFNVRFRGNKLSQTRFAFVVGKKAEKTSPGRNLAKRRMRSIVRNNLDGFKPGLDIVVTARRPAIGVDFAVFERELLKVFKRARLLP